MILCLIVVLNRWPHRQKAGALGGYSDGRADNQVDAPFTDAKVKHLLLPSSLQYVISFFRLSSDFVLASLISREIRVCLSKGSSPTRPSNSGGDIEWDHPYSASALLDGDRMPIPPIPTGKYNIALTWQSRETPESILFYKSQPANGL
ncbi:hypothetical protein GJ496_007897 [Pomphorhynchus laevis]|nr:hypothetical protein GJ496_007897 [Pomphorhynchus laevis]